MKPFRAFILRFVNDASHEAIERIMEEFPFEYAVSIGYKERMYSKLNPAQQRWFNSSNLRGGVYEGVDINELKALDEELLESMRHFEPVFMHLVTRLEFARRISFDERKRMYFAHLRFWNDYIERHNINLFLSGIMPHEIPDLLIYELCKVKGIPTYIFHATPIRDCAYLTENWEESAVHLGKRYEELTRQGGDVELNNHFQKYFEKQTEPSGNAAITFKRPTAIDRIVSLIKNNAAKATLEFIKWIPTLFSLSAWHRRFQKIGASAEQKKLRACYDRLSKKPDLSKKFIYVPLHFQPECSTCPMAGAFFDQEVTLQLLSAYVPDDVYLYVKEHPKQREKGFACRTTDFYEKIAAMRNVSLVTHDTDSFALREHCSAVATATGTAGLEAIFRSRPVLMFGHRFYQYAPGVHPIRTKEDCRKAMETIFEKNEKPDIADVRIFLKAVQDTCVFASITDWHQRQASDRTKDQNRDAIYEALAERLKHVL